MVKKDTGWWDDFFPSFQHLFKIVPQRVTNAEVRYITDKLGLEPGRKFLDCPCGIGRIAIPLAKKGIEVTGVDRALPYLDEFSKRMKRLHLKVNLVHSDMRRINFDHEFDAAGNLWTSFGFFEKDSDNLLVLKKMFKALKPGGRFLLHVINRDWIITNYSANGWSEVENVKVLEKRNFDYSKSINYSTYSLIENGSEKVIQTGVRMYSYHELIRMFKSVGFTEIEGYGSVKDEPIGRDKRMMFIFGTRPKRR